MLDSTGSCEEFRNTLHAYLDRDAHDMELIQQATFVSHVASCAKCRDALLAYNEHIQAQHFTANDGHLDRHSVRSLRKAIPIEFATISERIVRKRARELGQLKFQILQVYLRHVLSANVWPRVLDDSELPAAQAASHALLDNLEQYKESSVIMADGGMVDLKSLRSILNSPMDKDREGLEPQLRMIARGLLTARTLDPLLDEYVLQLLGVILEQLGHYSEARHLFLSLAQISPTTRSHLRAQALTSAAITSFAFLEDFEAALHYLQEAEQLYPQRWSIKWNFACFYLWPNNPMHNRVLARRYYNDCFDHPGADVKIHQILAQHPFIRNLMEAEGFIPASATEAVRV